MTRAELKSAAKEQIKGNIGRYFLCSLIVIVAYFLLVNLPMQSMIKKAAVSALYGRKPNLLPIYGLLLVATLVAAPLKLSFAKLDLGMTKGEKVEVAGLAKGYEKTLSCMGLVIVIQIFVTLWSLLLIVPGIIKSLSYSMSFYVLADNPEMTAMEALNESKQIMKGHKMDLFILSLSFILWILLGAVTLGLAFIYVTPYMKATLANFYNSIKVNENTEGVEL